MRSIPFGVPHRGFSLVELVGVLSVLAIMGVTAIPAVRALGDTRSARVVAEVRDALRRARSAATGLGTPCGVRISLGTQTIELLTLDGTTVEAMHDPSGLPVPATAIDPAGTVLVVVVTGATMNGASREIWFDRAGGRAILQASGAVDPTDDEAEIRFSTGQSIVVRGISGLVE